MNFDDLEEGGGFLSLQFPLALAVPFVLAAIGAVTTRIGIGCIVGSAGAGVNSEQPQLPAIASKSGIT